MLGRVRKEAHFWIAKARVELKTHRRGGEDAQAAEALRLESFLARFEGRRAGGPGERVGQLLLRREREVERKLGGDDPRQARRRSEREVRAEEGAILSRRLVRRQALASYWA